MPDTAIDSLCRFIAEMSKLQCIGHEVRPVFWFRDMRRSAASSSQAFFVTISSIESTSST